MKANIICGKYFDFAGNSTVIGGIESYITTLVTLFSEKGIQCTIFQMSNDKFEQVQGNFLVVGCGVRTPKELIGFIEKYKNIDLENDILIFSTDFLICRNQFKHSIAIQHGIAWDITALQKESDLNNILTVFKGTLRTVRKYTRYKHCRHLVCVDYNFVNWYRTQIAHIDIDLHVIPNYSKIPTEIEPKRNNNPRIIFARRLVEYRGTRIFTYAIQKVLKIYPEIEVTVAGEGPEEPWMKEQLNQYKNVQFIRYNAEESLTVHQRHDIAVVPTRGSEGTSLSLLEAMAAGCAVIATNVGGMTNIILDGYNGVMISPNVKELTEALLRLIEDVNRRSRIAQKGRETVAASFSYDKWKTKWLQVIEEVANE